MDALAGVCSAKHVGGRLPADVWICGNIAGHEDRRLVYNQPTDNLLLCLPPITCTGCGNVNPAAEYVWSIMECTLNDMELDLRIRNQGEDDTCEAHVVLAAMELMGKINGLVYHGALPACNNLDMEDLLRKFLARYTVAFSYAEHLAWPERELRILRILKVAQADGVGYEAPPATPADAALRMSGAFRVSARDIQHVVRLLAGGHPLVAAVATGRTFCYEGAGRIYNGVTLNKNYCVLLVGSGVAHWPGEAMDHNGDALHDWPTSPSSSSGQRRPCSCRVFFRARASYDDRANPVYASVAMGVDFDIWAEDLVDSVWGFHLAS